MISDDLHGVVLDRLRAGVDILGQVALSRDRRRQVALHLGAIRNLRGGECDTALIGSTPTGVRLRLDERSVAGMRTQVVRFV